jgi:hypothetical protein
MQYGPSGNPSKARRPWSGADAALFTQNLGWVPDGDVYANYYTIKSYSGSGTFINSCGCVGPAAGTGFDFCVLGSSDLDGDFVRPVYKSELLSGTKTKWCVPTLNEATVF